jgi:hypothetical protein
MNATFRIAPSAVVACSLAAGTATDAGDRADVRTSFIAADSGRLDDGPKAITTGPEPAGELVIPDWDRPWPPADPPLLEIDRSRIAIRVDPSLDPAGGAAVEAALDAGLAAGDLRPVGTRGWHLVDLDAPMPSSRCTARTSGAISVPARRSAGFSSAATTTTRIAGPGGHAW